MLKNGIKYLFEMIFLKRFCLLQHLFTYFLDFRSRIKCYLVLIANKNICCFEGNQI